ncbi:PhoH family protein [Oxalobacter formigenes]|uniref:PhoH family protein n=1 Tax=Oxalobacter formigenes OXCC13 TaxID=556269 RepID=C3XA51_OXAFO|nr:PhoH family protein [Oxalobacter formigenes]ARQ45784.1 PhoH-like protein [Oxalobacter formigenes]ARQ78014.1 phosphate starvation-inducible protein PhoH [Oxalobacter formigenes OXCC13]EEO30077.1 PhoH family protein [Oxalobacter formigenes OXCC13]MCZ4062307.1 PhoH family protein [Oxalobacter formigenes]QDX33436.1 PhoH family protein [Oxalobacter formigenes]
MPLPKMPTKPADTITQKDMAATKLPANATPKAKKKPATKTAVTAKPETTTAKASTSAAKAAPKNGQKTAQPVSKAKLPPRPPRKKLVETTKQSPLSRAASQSGETKLFVLDTNVLMHDPTCLFRFEEHDIYLPMITLEELDNHKRGMSDVARNVRQVTRTLDQLVADVDETELMEKGIPLNKLGNKEAQGHLYFQTKVEAAPLPKDLASDKADNQILGVMMGLVATHPTRAIVMVSKDINMRIKARALGLSSEDYFNDQVLEDSDLLYPGTLQLPADFWEKHGKNIETWHENDHHGVSQTFYRISGPLVPSMVVNQFVYMEPQDGETPFQAQVKELNGKTAVLETLHDYMHSKNNVWGITARNREQNFAFNILLNPDIDIVTLVGQAGTGKTLLALAAGLAQVLETKRYNEVIVTRVTIPVGEDIGFLPGTEEEKMSPWMGALDDNLEVLSKSDQSEGGEWGRATTQELIRSRISVKSLNFMRGRTFVNKFLIIDEAQNLTPKQMKTLITRAGPGTKIVCLGNIAQIDTPYLTEGSSGLTYVVDRFRGWEHGGHVMLARGERSRLADYATDVL